MQVITASEARANMDQVDESHQPVAIAGKRQVMGWGMVEVENPDFDENAIITFMPGAREALEEALLAHEAEFLAR